MSVSRRSLLVHPLPVAALVLLVFNDHFFKGAAVLPSWLTGKLSDFAGLVLLPLLLCEVLLLLRLPVRRTLVITFAAVAALFTAIKCVDAANHAYVSASAWLLRPFGYSASSVLDATDLLALCVLPGVFLWANRRAASSGEQATPPTA